MPARTSTSTSTPTPTATPTATATAIAIAIAMLGFLLVSCSVASPKTEIVDALARAAPFELQAGAARVRVTRARFADVEVSVEGNRAQVLAVVDADGRVGIDGGEVAVGYVGREAFELERCTRARWCPVGSALPALSGVVATLAAVARSAERRPVGWQIRIERDRALVGEDAVGAGGARTTRGTLDLVRDGGTWRLAAPR